MDWDAIGAIGEMAGAMGVIVTLVYLARQVTTSNRLARAEAFRSSNDGLISLNAAFQTDEQHREVLGKVIYDRARRSDLSRQEWLTIDGYLISVIDIYEQLYREVGEGVLDPAVLEEFTPLGLFRLPYFRDSWRDLYRDYVSPSFVQFFEEKFALSTDT